MLRPIDELEWKEMDSEMDKILRMISLFIASPIDIDREKTFFEILEMEYPQVNLLKELRQFYVWTLDNPDRYDRMNPKFHIRFRKWCMRVSEKTF